MTKHSIEELKDEHVNVEDPETVDITIFLMVKWFG